MMTSGGDIDTASGRSRRMRSGASAFLAAVLFLVAGCIPGRLSSETEEGTDGSTIPSAPTSEGAIADSTPLEMVMSRDSVACDSTDREVGEIRGAKPGERILFSSSVPIPTLEGIADQAGRYRLSWNCSPAEARLSWELEATGHDSGRRVRFTVIGALSDSLTDGGLDIDILNGPFTCDGSTRKIGTIAGAEPGEDIVFTSPESGDLRPGKADAYGDLDLHWECEPVQAGTTWTVTATSADSGRTGTFVIAGVPIDPGSIEELTVVVTEEPFICDGKTRNFATISNFAPLEVIDFSSPDATGLIDAKADSAGEISPRWQCDLEDVGKTWSLTALGTSTQRTATLTITGAAPPEGTVPELTVAIIEEPFGCDGLSRPFATISNLTPGEFVDFTSPQATGLRQGQAAEDGELPVRWQCGAGDIDKIWELTATGKTSGKSITLTVTGATPKSG